MSTVEKDIKEESEKITKVKKKFFLSTIKQESGLQTNLESLHVQLANSV